MITGFFCNSDIMSSGIDAVEEAIGGEVGPKSNAVKESRDYEVSQGRHQPSQDEPGCEAISRSDKASSPGYGIAGKVVRKQHEVLSDMQASFEHQNEGSHQDPGAEQNAARKTESYSVHLGKGANQDGIVGL